MKKIKCPMCGKIPIIMEIDEDPSIWIIANCDCGCSIQIIDINYIFKYDKSKYDEGECTLEFEERFK